MLALDRIFATRIAATPQALDSAAWPDGALVLRLAPDEALVTPMLADFHLSDPHAIVVSDSGFAGAWLAAAEALEVLQRCCEWQLPGHRPAFAQGAVAGIPAKLWFEEDRVFFLVPAPFAHDFQERVS